MVIVLFLIIIIFVMIIIFSFPSLSPIPYFPSNKKDLKLIIKALNLKNDQVILDLGAGDGIIIFEAAKKAFDEKLNTQFIATEINPILLLILYFRNLFHPNRKNIRIMYADMFSMNFSFLQPTTYNLQPIFYLYISPWYLEKTLDNIKKQIKKFNVVSYMYEIPSLIKIQKSSKGINNVYVYNV